MGAWEGLLSSEMNGMLTSTCLCLAGGQQEDEAAKPRDENEVTHPDHPGSREDLACDSVHEDLFEAILTKFPISEWSEGPEGLRVKRPLSTGSPKFSDQKVSKIHILENKNK